MTNWHDGTFWEYIHCESGHWIGICDELKMTLQCDTIEDLEDEIDEILSCEIIKALMHGATGPSLVGGWSSSGLKFQVPIEVLKKIQIQNCGCDYENMVSCCLSETRRSD